jgi:hypothetical protein
VREITRHAYDVIGISAIVVNVGKVREMCRLVREHSPQSTIVVGGHVTSIANIEQMIDADHVASGEGVAWLRGFLLQELGVEWIWLGLESPAAATRKGKR